MHREDPKEGNIDNPRTGEPVLQRKTEEVQSLLPEKTRLGGDPITAAQDVHGRSEEDGGSLCRRSPLGKAMADGYELHQKRFHLNMKETLNNENSNSLEQPSQGQASITGGFHMQLVRV